MRIEKLVPSPVSLPPPVDQEVELPAASLVPCPLACDHASHHGDNGLTSETVPKSQLNAFFFFYEVPWLWCPFTVSERG